MQCIEMDTNEVEGGSSIARSMLLWLQGHTQSTTHTISTTCTPTHTSDKAKVFLLCLSVLSSCCPQRTQNTELSSGDKREGHSQGFSMPSLPPHTNTHAGLQTGKSHVKWCSGKREGFLKIVTPLRRNCPKIWPSVGWRVQNKHWHQWAGR